MEKDGYELYVESNNKESERKEKREQIGQEKKEKGQKAGEMKVIEEGKEMKVIEEASFLWNEKFQNLLEQTLTETGEELERAHQLRNLCQQFEKVALECGKHIIELHLGLHSSSSSSTPSLPSEEGGKEEKIIEGLKRVQKGVGGGDKYVHTKLGIFFKLCVDRFGLYGGEEGMMKAAGNELKAMIELVGCRIKGLHFPLIVLIDYLGFRLIAESILPLSFDSIVYGSKLLSPLFFPFFSDLTFFFLTFSSFPFPLFTITSFNLPLTHSFN